MEIQCQQVGTMPTSTEMLGQYKHKKDTKGGKSGQTSSLNFEGMSRVCDANGDWKTTCKDGNSDTDEVDCR